MLDFCLLHELEVEDGAEVEGVEAGISNDGFVVQHGGLLHEGHGFGDFHGDARGSGDISGRYARTGNSATETSHDGRNEAEHFLCCELMKMGRSFAIVID